MGAFNTLYSVEDHLFQWGFPPDGFTFYPPVFFPSGRRIITMYLFIGSLYVKDFVLIDNSCWEYLLYFYVVNFVIIRSFKDAAFFAFEYCITLIVVCPDLYTWITCIFKVIDFLFCT